MKAVLEGLGHAALPGDGQYLADFLFDNDGGAAYEFTVSSNGEVVLADDRDDPNSMYTIADLEAAWAARPGSRELFVTAARAFDAAVRSGGFVPTFPSGPPPP